MTLTRIVSFAAVVGLMALAVAKIRDPHRTKLPFGTTDLSSVQTRLDALPDSERALVLGYVRRSRGDVLPPKFADPSEALTARTFGEAIALQRRFLAGQAVRDAHMAARGKARDKTLAPLRAALELQLVGRAIVPRSRALQPAGLDQTAYAALGTPIDDRPTLVTTWRVQNVAGLTVESLRGYVDVRDADQGPTAVGRLSICHFEHREPLTPGQSTEIRCAMTEVPASAGDSAYVGMPERDLVIDWTPTAIVFANGTSLEYTGN
jgi:hypothetical protein